LSFAACVIYPCPFPGAHLLQVRDPEDLRHDSVMFAHPYVCNGGSSSSWICTLVGPGPVPYLVSSTSSSDPPLADS
jgi:hypothetical protein